MGRSGMRLVLQKILGDEPAKVVGSGWTEVIFVHARIGAIQTWVPDRIVIGEKKTGNAFGESRRQLRVNGCNEQHGRGAGGADLPGIIAISAGSVAIQKNI